MKNHISRLSVITLILMFVINSVSSQHLVKGDRFSITFPYEPSYESNPIQTDVGEVMMHTYMYENDGVVYMCSYTDYPASLNTEGQSATMLKNAQTGFTNQLQIKVSYENKTLIGNYEGLYFKADNKEVYAVLKSYLIGKRLYQIGIMTYYEYPTQTVIDSFLNSFSLK